MASARDTGVCASEGRVGHLSAPRHQFLLGSGNVVAFISLYNHLV